MTIQAQRHRAWRRPARSGDFGDCCDLRVHRLGFGAMRMTVKEILGRPKDRGEAVTCAAEGRGLDYLSTRGFVRAFGQRGNNRRCALTLSKELVMRRKRAGAAGPPSGSERQARRNLAQVMARGSCRRLRVDGSIFSNCTEGRQSATEDQLGRYGVAEGGKIKHNRLSEVSLSQIENALNMADCLRCRTATACWIAEAEDVLSIASAEKIGVHSVFPLGAGQLSAAGSKRAQSPNRRILTPCSLRWAWLLRRSA